VPTTNRGVTSPGEVLGDTSVAAAMLDRLLCRSAMRNLDGGDNRPRDNRRLALAATITFYGLNGLRLILSNDEAYELVLAVAGGELDDVERIAGRLESGTAPWSRRAARHLHLTAARQPGHAAVGPPSH
jgi:hypothetical protein